MSARSPVSGIIGAGTDRREPDVRLATPISTSMAVAWSAAAVVVSQAVIISS